MPSSTVTVDDLLSGSTTATTTTTTTTIPAIASNKSINTYFNNRNRAGSSGSGIPNSPSADEDDSFYDGDHDHDPEVNNFYGQGVIPGGAFTSNSVGIFAPTNTTINKGSGQYDLCGSMWKRRFGLGRNADRNWVMRCFTLSGPNLSYHEEPDIQSVADLSKPRAHLNLSKVETIAEMHSKQKPGLPTQDLLTINIYDPIIHAKRKWEMCCTSKEQQLLWYKAINAYDGKPVMGFTTGSNDKLSGVPEPPVPPYMHHGQLTPDINTATTARFTNRDASTLDDVQIIAKAAAKAAEILLENQPKQGMNVSNEMMALIIVGLNMIIYSVRNGSERTFQAIQFFMNAIALYGAYRHILSSPTKSSSKSQRGPKARAAKLKTNQPEKGPPSGKEVVPIDNHSSFAKVLSVGSTIPRAPPTRHSELAKQLYTHDWNSVEAIRAFAAAPTDAIEVTPHSYANTDASTFQLRVGPNYKKNKQKAPSAPALYDLLSMDFLYADSALKNTSDKFQIPSIPGITDVSTGHAHIPPMLIINTWLPGEEPSMFQKSVDGGETYSIPMIFVLSKNTLEQLKDMNTASPGVKLWSEWCHRAENEPDFRGRFKCMGMIENIESTGVPKFIQGYNGKPALVTKSGTFTRHERYIEFSINVHMWAYVAKKGLYALVPSFPDFIFNIGFTIEARKDEEMPEVLLGGCRLMNLDPDKAVVDGVDDVDMM